MKKLLIFVFSMMMVLSLAACGGSTSTSENNSKDEQTSIPAGKTLVAYFSVTNNTEGVAKKLADGLGADIYEITPKEPYTDEDIDYGNDNSRTSIEMNDPDARPAIEGSVEDMDQYDTVFLGYPIWWGEAPRILSTFIESYDFAGKTIVPFCTSGGSGFDDSDAALKAAAENAKWLDGHRFGGGASEDEIMEWAGGLEIK